MAEGRNNYVLDSYRVSTRMRNSDERGQGCYGSLGWGWGMGSRTQAGGLAIANSNERKAEHSGKHANGNRWQLLEVPLLASIFSMN